MYTQYREQGAHIWRGYTIEQVINQLIGNNDDLGRGRQMPVHYGSKAINMVTVSSPLSNFIVIQQLRFHKLLVLDMLSEKQKKIKSQLAI